MDPEIAKKELARIVYKVFDRHLGEAITDNLINQVELEVKSYIDGLAEKNIIPSYEWISDNSVHVLQNRLASPTRLDIELPLWLLKWLNQ
jgi:hypothetical protein